MILLDKPFVSKFLEETILRNNYPTLASTPVNDLNLLNEIKFLGSDVASRKLNEVKFPLVYTNSENSIDWVEKNLGNTNLPDIINLFKDKVRFRRSIQKLYPDYFFQEVKINNLKNLDISSIPFPIILKPAVGFFSMGVYKILSVDDWRQKINSIESEIEHVKHLYPLSVLNTGNFIIEKYIDGEEFAFDAYFNEFGEPVVLNIFHHLFSHSEDVGDRVYLSSPQIIKEKLEPFTNFLFELTKFSELKNFPLHIEVRVTEDNRIFPIEINPMRFGGWCTTADSTYFSYEINSIEYFFEQKKPDWDKILTGKEDKLYSIIVLDNSTGYKPHHIKSFDYDKLLSKFNNILEFRKMDIVKTNVFGFIFCETDKSNFIEIEQILKSDLREYIEI
ncbi:MAG: ATP-grasp domain-containing protein [Melioribacteraceae bacterium]|nr:ATP-grasp domain-containing protein [Melioribacteraceae bacterium]